MASNDVYVGFWINWEAGALMGATLTLPRQWGVILIAFMALFIRFAGSHLWNIVCFVIHQIRATPDDHCDTHRQIQVILRSETSESRVLKDMIKIGWNRRHVPPATLCTYIPLLCITGLHMLAISAAGLFSSRVITTNNEALVRSPLCGWLTEVSRFNLLSDDSELDTAKILLVMGRYSYQQSLIYARACYGQEYNGYSSICSSFVQPQIHTTVNSSAPCPFAPVACDGPAISVDTGFIDSDRHLGVNTHKNDRISVKKVATCAPLRSERYSNGWIPNPYGDEAPLSNSSTSFQTYTFGSNIHPELNNDTFQFFIVDSAVYPTFNPYFINWVNYYVGNWSETDIDPLPDLRTGDADLIIMSLFPAAAYSGRVEDPWFKAERPHPIDNQTFWISEKSLTFLGCTERYQMCSQSQCTPLTGLYQINPDNSLLSNLSSTQTAVSRLLWKAMWAGQFNYAMMLLNQEVLLARDSLWGASDYRSVPLPSTQWQDEAVNLLNISLALLQRRIVEFASPPNYKNEFDIASHIEPPKTGVERNLCEQIKISTNAYTSFHVLGVFTTILFGLIIICAGPFLPTLVGWLQMRWEIGEYKRVQWKETGIFELLRAAYEGRSLVSTTEREDKIPGTETLEQKFPALVR